MKIQGEQHGRQHNHFPFIIQYTHNHNTHTVTNSDKVIYSHIQEHTHTRPNNLTSFK